METSIIKYMILGFLIMFILRAIHSNDIIENYIDSNVIVDWIQCSNFYNQCNEDPTRYINPTSTIKDCSTCTINDENCCLHKKTCINKHGDTTNEPFNCTGLKGIDTTLTVPTLCGEECTEEKCCTATYNSCHNINGDDQDKVFFSCPTDEEYTLTDKDIICRYGPCDKNICCTGSTCQLDEGILSSNGLRFIQTGEVDTSTITPCISGSIPSGDDGTCEVKCNEAEYDCLVSDGDQGYTYQECVPESMVTVRCSSNRESSQLEYESPSGNTTNRPCRVKGPMCINITCDEGTVKNHETECHSSTPNCESTTDIKQGGCCIGSETGVTCSIPDYFISYREGTPANENVCIGGTDIQLGETCVYKCPSNSIFENDEGIQITTENNTIDVYKQLRCDYGGINNDGDIIGELVYVNDKYTWNPGTSSIHNGNNICIDSNYRQYNSLASIPAVSINSLENCMRICNSYSESNNKCDGIIYEQDTENCQLLNRIPSTDNVMDTETQSSSLPCYVKERIYEEKLPVGECEDCDNICKVSPSDTEIDEDVNCFKYNDTKGSCINDNNDCIWINDINNYINNDSSINTLSLTRLNEATSDCSNCVSDFEKANSSINICGGRGKDPNPLNALHNDGELYSKLMVNNKFSGNFTYGMLNWEPGTSFDDCYNSNLSLMSQDDSGWDRGTQDSIQNLYNIRKEKLSHWNRRIPDWVHSYVHWTVDNDYKMINFHDLISMPGRCTPTGEKSTEDECLNIDLNSIDPLYYGNTCEEVDYCTYVYPTTEDKNEDLINASDPMERNNNRAEYATRYQFLNYDGNKSNLRTPDIGQCRSKGLFPHWNKVVDSNIYEWCQPEEDNGGNRKRLTCPIMNNILWEQVEGVDYGNDFHTSNVICNSLEDNMIDYLGNYPTLSDCKHLCEDKSDCIAVTWLPPERVCIYNSDHENCTSDSTGKCYLHDILDPISVDESSTCHTLNVDNDDNDNDNEGVIPKYVDNRQTEDPTGVYDTQSIEGDHYKTGPWPSWMNQTSCSDFNCIQGERGCLYNPWSSPPNHEPTAPLEEGAGGFPLSNGRMLECERHPECIRKDKWIFNVGDEIPGYGIETNLPRLRESDRNIYTIDPSNPMTHPSRFWRNWWWVKEMEDISSIPTEQPILDETTCLNKPGRTWTPGSCSNGTSINEEECEAASFNTWDAEQEPQVCYGRGLNRIEELTTEADCLATKHEWTSSTCSDNISQCWSRDFMDKDELLYYWRTAKETGANVPFQRSAFVPQLMRNTGICSFPNTFIWGAWPEDFTKGLTSPELYNFCKNNSANNQVIHQGGKICDMWDWCNLIDQNEIPYTDIYPFTGMKQGQTDRPGISKKWYYKDRLKEFGIGGVFEQR